MKRIKNKCVKVNEYRKKNKELITQRKKVYSEKNKEAIAEKMKKPIMCDCGVMTSYGHRHRHEQTNKHKLYVDSINN